MPIRELPAVDWLGYSIDLSRSPVMDLRAASVSVKKSRRIINFDPSANLREVDINGVVYDVPQVIRISQEALFQGLFLTYPSGSEASKAFRADAGLPARYFAVTGSDTAILLAQDRSFISDNQYAFYNFSYSAYTARLAEYLDLLNETALLRGIDGLPQKFDGDNDANVAAYREFFQIFGTHVLVNVIYGARFQLNAWASNANSSVNAKFSTDVQAYFNGIPTGGEFDKGVKSESQYKVFLEYLQRLVTVVGGDARLSSNLVADPTDWTTYTQWTASVYKGTPNHTSFHTVSLWTLMSTSPNAILRRYADELNLAFTWILTHPRIFKTAITFDIQSDWAEFNLLAPGAVLLQDDAHPFPSQTLFSPSRVQWGKEHSHVYQRQTLRFVVVNDGNPIDFSISHGSHGAAPNRGRAEAIVDRERYVNDVITDNVWNTVWFFDAPVSLVPEPFSLRQRGGGYSWDDLLDAYLTATRTGKGLGGRDVHAKDV